MRFLSAFAMLVALLPAAAGAITIHVEQDGSGDFTTIQDAVSSAVSGDTVLVGPGTYSPPHQFTIDVPLTMLSAGGPEVTVIDGRNAVTLLAVEYTTATIAGLTFSRGFDPGIGVFSLQVFHATVSFANCRFIRNQNAVQLTASTATFDGCAFRGNTRSIEAASYPGDLTIDRCTFLEESWIGTRGMFFANGTLKVTRSLFRGYNTGVWDIGPVGGSGAISGEISGNTFDSCGLGRQQGLPYIVITSSQATVSIHHNIFSNTRGYAVRIDAVASRSCNLYFNNSAGDIYLGTLGVGEVNADPQYCDIYRDYRLAATSPALAANNACGLMGAFDLGCAAPAAHVVETVTVAQNGPADFENLQDAIDYAAPGDTIVIDDGTYESVLVRKGLTLRSVHGPQSTIVDAQGSGSGITIDSFDVPVTVQGVSFVNGYATAGAGINAAFMQLLTLRDCTFKGNDGGAVDLDHSDGLIEHCRFEGNSAYLGGAAVRQQYGAMAIKHCEFISNQSNTLSFGDPSTLDINGCLFAGNSASSPGNGAAALQVWHYYVPGYATAGPSRSPAGGNVGIIHNTFHDNASLGGAPTVNLDEQGIDQVEVSQNIFAGEKNGAAVNAHSGNHACNVFWDNAAGSLKNDSLATDEIEADPLFCSPDSMVFTISDASPAAPAHSLCGHLIGAFPVACNLVATLISEFRATTKAGAVELIWRLVSDDVITGYQILRTAGKATQVFPAQGWLAPHSRSFRDGSVEAGRTYTYTLVVVREGDDPVQSMPLSVSTPALVPALAQNRPNPFTTSTRIDYVVEHAGRMFVGIFDVRGARVRTLVDEEQAPGARSLTWDGRNDRGDAVAAGIYFVRLRAEKFSAARKMLLVR